MWATNLLRQHRTQAEAVREVDSLLAFYAQAQALSRVYRTTDRAGEAKADTTRRAAIRQLRAIRRVLVGPGRDDRAAVRRINAAAAAYAAGYRRAFPTLEMALKARTREIASSERSGCPAAA